MSHSQFRCITLILRHAWLSLWDKHMTTGRINQVTILKPPSAAQRQQSAAGSKVCQNWWSPRASQTHWFVRLRTCFRDLQSIGAYTQSTDRWSKCSLRVGAFGANLLQLEAFALRRSRICEAGLANTIHTQSYNNLCSLWEGLRCSSSA